MMDKIALVMDFLGTCQEPRADWSYATLPHDTGTPHSPLYTYQYHEAMYRQEVLIVVLIACLLFGGVLWKAISQGGGSRAARTGVNILLMLGLGELVRFVTLNYLFQGGRYFGWELPLALDAASIALLFAMWLGQGSLSWKAIPIYSLGLLAIRSVLNAGILLDEFSWSTLCWQWERPWFPTIELTTTAVLTAGAWFLVTGPQEFLLFQQRLTQGSAPSRDHEFTRLALATAVTGGSSFRRKVIKIGSDNPYAPEPGLNFGLLFRWCGLLERRERAYQLVAIALLGVAVSLLIALEHDRDLPAALSSVVVMFVLMAVIKRFHERFKLLEPLRAAHFEPLDFEARFLGPVSSRAEPANVTVYKDFFPFASAGIPLEAWSFTIDMSRPRNDLEKSREPRPFAVSELYEAVESSLASLGIPSLSIRDWLFVDGASVPPELLDQTTHRPLRRVDESVLERFVDHPTNQARTYKWISIEDWGGELVVSHFLKCSIVGRALAIEVSRHVLPPAPPASRRVDTYRRKGARSYVSTVLQATLMSPITIPPMWGMFALAVVDRITRAFGIRKKILEREITDNPAFNHGAPQSLRSQMSSDQFISHFQRMDHELYGKLIQRQILDAITDFLEDRDVDTGELRERQTTILNQGILIQRGDIAANSIAVGKGARSLISRITGRRIAAKA